MKRHAMIKHVPDSLKDHILPFHWDVKKVWDLDAKAETVERVRFDYLLELPLWSSVSGQGMLFDISPMAVIRNPKASPHQEKRFAATDTSYPLDFLMYEGRPWVLDGVHRLARHYMMDTGSIQVRFHDPESIPSMKVYRELEIRRLQSLWRSDQTASSLPWGSVK